MKRFFKPLFLVSFALLSVLTFASSQQKLKINSPIGVLLAPIEATDIGLTKDQHKQIMKAFEDFKAQLQALMSAGVTSIADLEDRMAVAGEACKKKVKEIVTPEQWQRSRELELQMGAVNAIQDPEVSAKLKLTERQNASITETFDAYLEKSKELRAQVMDAKEKQGKIFEMGKKARATIEGVLTAEQKEILEKLKGKPLKLGG